MPWWVIAVYALAVARLTGLIVQDDITAPIRERLQTVAAHPHPARLFVSELVGCPWCVSIWVGTAVAPVAMWWPSRPWALWPALALSSSQIAGMVSRLGRG